MFREDWRFKIQLEKKEAYVSYTSKKSKGKLPITKCGGYSELMYASQVEIQRRIEYYPMYIQD